MTCGRCAAEFDQVWRWCPECGLERSPVRDILVGDGYSVDWVIDLEPLVDLSELSTSDN